MKKIMTAVLALLLSMTMLCGAFAEAAGVTGVWYGDMFGMIATLTINEDGSYALEMMGDSVPGVWTLEGDTLYMDKGTDVEAAFPYDAAAQTIDAGGVFFGREPIEAFVPGAAVAAAAIEDFAGSWTATNVDAFDALMPVDAAGFYMDAAIEGAKVTLTINFVGEEIEEGEAVFADGVLTLTIPAENEFDEEGIYVISMLDSGMLSISTELFSGPATFYLEKLA